MPVHPDIPNCWIFFPLGARSATECPQPLGANQEQMVGSGTLRRTEPPTQDAVAFLVMLPLCCFTLSGLGSFLASR